MKISKAAEKLVDKSYALGNTANGFDCLNSLKEFYTEFGYIFPSEYKGYTWENYSERWEKFEDDCRIILKEFLESLGTEVPNPNFSLPGDLLLFETATFPVFPAIMLDNGKMLLVTKAGCKVTPVKPFRKWLKSVRRLINEPQVLEETK